VQNSFHHFGAGLGQVSHSQHKSAHFYTAIQTSRIWQKNICAFLSYRNFRVSVFFWFTLYSQIILDVIYIIGVR